MSNLDAISAKICEQKNLSSFIAEWRYMRSRVVFTNGCFDVLHFGHACYLAKAKDLGDKMIIGLNSDISVRKLKGETRPINNQHDRAMLLASLQFVDAIVVFDEDTPERLIKEIKPDVLVKGGDYSFDTIVGAEFVSSYGGKVVTIPLVEGLSSTKIISKMK